MYTISLASYRRSYGGVTVQGERARRAPHRSCDNMLLTPRRTLSLKFFTALSSTASAHLISSFFCHNALTNIRSQAPPPSSHRMASTRAATGNSRPRILPTVPTSTATTKKASKPATANTPAKRAPAAKKATTTKAAKPAGVTKKAPVKKPTVGETLKGVVKKVEGAVEGNPAKKVRRLFRARVLPLEKTCQMIVSLAVFPRLLGAPS